MPARKSLEVKDLNIRVEGERVEGPGPNKGAGQILKVHVKVVNLRPDVAYHVVSKLLELRYDEKTKTLIASFREPPEDPELKKWDIHTAAVPIDEIAPGKSKTLSFSVPRVMKQVNVRRGKITFSETDISDMAHVAFAIQYNEAPFYPNETESSKQTRARFSIWGKTMEKKLDGSVPQPES